MRHVSISAFISHSIFGIINRNTNGEVDTSFRVISAKKTELKPAAAVYYTEVSAITPPKNSSRWINLLKIIQFKAFFAPPPFLRLLLLLPAAAILLPSSVV